MDKISIIKPDDWHVHLRDKDALKTTVPAAMRCFERCIIMPNLLPPVTSADSIKKYRDSILSYKPSDSTWTPLMVMYLTDQTSKKCIKAAYDQGLIFGCKYYPAGATTNSATGVSNPNRLNGVFGVMQELGIILQIHGEVTESSVDIFDREKVFIDRHLTKIKHNFPELKIVLEHVTTKQGVDFVRDSDGYIAATITPQHLLFNRNDMLAGGIRPHLFCLPILKRDLHQNALIKAATSGEKKFFLGTDSAPHARENKENICGCAGCFSHHAAIELYAEAFERAGALHQLEQFASVNGAEFYGLEKNSELISLLRDPWQVPNQIDYRNSSLVPLAAGTTLNWRLEI
ncbi:MAG: dihydroorotase [Porticoccaceae bacterium]|nr:dihydroorotase [Porticoccaceae bacterium]|tara:strand:+ start:757 stop:1791 length:1035 start_codon:yes stop_codon:yes gene_type:complete